MRFLPLLALLAVGPAQAQMPDLRAMSGQPLPVADLPAGTVVLRVVRGGVTNPAAGVQVTTTTRTRAGEARSGSGKTGADGRVTFEGLPVGGEFEATVTVDGERLDTARFRLPPTGGTRVMLIAGLGAAPAAEDGAEGGAADKPTFRMGTPTGTVAPASDLPPGTLELDLRDGGGRPLAGLRVQVAEVRIKADGGHGGQPEREVGLHEGTSDAAGRVRFTKLTIGEGAGYAAVTEHEGLRFGVQPFRMPAESGMRGQITSLRRTTDARVLGLDPRSKVIIDLREDAVQVMLALLVRNSSPEIYDPGEGGLTFSLPEAAVGAQELQGSEPLDIAGREVRLKSPIPPDSGASVMTQVRFGYVIPSDGDSTLDLRQILPIAMPEPFILVPGKAGITLEGGGVRQLPDQTDNQGEKVLVYTATAVAAAGALPLRITGIPARDRTGRVVAATLSLLLLGAGIVFAGPGKGGQTAAERESLAERREKLFEELVAIERQRKSEPEARAGSNGRFGDRRRELVTKLESVYRDLAKLEETATL